MLRSIAEEIWGYEDEVRLPGGLRLPTRATVMRFPDGQVAIHSPLAIDDATAAEIDRLGDVRFLIAPSCLHWMYLAEAKARYPRARVFAAPALAKKLGDLPFEPLPDAGTLDGTGNGLRVERVRGVPTLDEHTFLHEASRSLVVTDLIFNLHACPDWRMRLVLRLTGAWKRTAQSLEWRLLVRDRAAAARSVTSILDWDWERIVVGHGAVVDDDPRERARRALAWMMKRTPPLLTAGAV
jgi:hypothetical protein